MVNATTRPLIRAHTKTELGERNGFLDIDSPLLAFGMMDIRLQTGPRLSGEAESQVTYLYK